MFLVFPSKQSQRVRSTKAYYKSVGLFSLAVNAIQNAFSVESMVNITMAKQLHVDEGFAIQVRILFLFIVGIGQAQWNLS